MDQSGDKVDAAGGRAHLDQQRIACAHDDTGHQRPQDLTGGGVVGKGGQVDFLKDQESGGKNQRIDHGAKGCGAADHQIHHNGQRNIDQQAHIAHGETGQVLDNGANAADARGGKAVGKDKNVIA